MTYSITYASSTGNTAQLAESIRAVLPPQDRVYYGAPTPEAAEADLVFAGFWTDKGGCSQDMFAFLQSLTGKKVFLFGTAGFGGADDYFQQILKRVAAHLDDTNTLVGTFMCQGKMPASVRARYAALAETDPDKAAPLLANFDRALAHPDADDRIRLEKAVSPLLEKE